MNKLYRYMPGSVLLLIIVMIFPGCLKDKLTKTYTILTPVYASKSAVLSKIGNGDPKAIGKPGKIFLYGKYIFLNEVNKGVHIIDNGNPSSPVNKAFLDIPGNIDIAVKGNILYADMYGDLLAIDISNPANVKLQKLIENIFPERQYENGFVPEPGLIITDWIKKDTTVSIDASGSPGWPCRDCGILFADAGSTGSKSASVPGIAGSMARFALVNDYLYAVDRHTLRSINISQPADPKPENEINAGWDIETIYPFQEKLFLGSMGGMFVFNISNPSQPVKESEFVHARACDPVITDGINAFITLRAGTFCGPSANELLVVDVKNLSQPKLQKTYPMVNPYGLSKDGNMLFVCDGSNGLRVFGTSDIMNFTQLAHITGIETYDCVAWNNNLVLVCSNGIRQYNYSDPSNIKLVSSLSINP